MQEELSKQSEASCRLEQRLLNLRFTHKATPVSLLEALTFRNPRRATLEIHKRCGLSECLLLQTCNRTEIYFVASEDPENARRVVIEYWLSASGVSEGEFQKHLEESRDGEALRLSLIHI